MAPSDTGNVKLRGAPGGKSMKFAELQKALEPTAGSLRVNGGQLQSAHISSLLADFLPDGIFD